jgi:hypothetical protein
MPAMIMMNNNAYSQNMSSQERGLFDHSSPQINATNTSATPVTSFLRGGAPAPGMMLPNAAGGMGGNSNSMAAMMNSMNGGMNGGNMNNFNLNDLKRLQQLQQFQGTPSNPLLPPQSGRPQNDPSAAILQSYLDQKVQTSRFDESAFRQTLGMNMGGMGSNLLQERFMMNQAGGQGQGELPLPSPHSLFHRDGSRRMRGGVIEPFPEKLHRLLLEVEAAGRSDVISFVAQGRAFAIHKPDIFFKEIVPLYFRQSRLSSFKRQLNLYGFELINTGPARGGYYHELFVKNAPEACRRMRRVAVKVVPKGDSDSKKESSKDSDLPDKLPKNKATIENADADE